MTLGDYFLAFVLDIPSSYHRRRAAAILSIFDPIFHISFLISLNA